MNAVGLCATWQIADLLQKNDLESVDEHLGYNLGIDNNPALITGGSSASGDVNVGIGRGGGFGCVTSRVLTDRHFVTLKFDRVSSNIRAGSRRGWYKKAHAYSQRRLAELVDRNLRSWFAGNFWDACKSFSRGSNRDLSVRCGTQTHDGLD